MNRCKYCKKELAKSKSGGFYVCDCKKAQKDWKISMDIQMIKKQLRIRQKELSDLYDEEKAL